MTTHHPDPKLLDRRGMAAFRRRHSATLVPPRRNDPCHWRGPGSDRGAGEIAGMVGTRPTVRLGMLTPSSNSILEPMTARLLAEQPGITAHFARLRVTQIGLSTAALGQFD